MQAPKANLTVALMGVLIAASAPGRVVAQCLEYGEHALYGTLVRQTYPGPPNYKSIKRGDKPLYIWVLVLDARVCVADPGLRYPEREVRIVLEDAAYEQYQDLLGKEVVVTGDLEPGHGDYKRLVMVPREIALTRGRP